MIFKFCLLAAASFLSGWAITDLLDRAGTHPAVSLVAVAVFSLALGLTFLP